MCLLADSCGWACRGNLLADEARDVARRAAQADAYSAPMGPTGLRRRSSTEELRPILIDEKRPRHPHNLAPRRMSCRCDTPWAARHDAVRGDLAEKTGRSDSVSSTADIGLRHSVATRSEVRPVWCGIEMDGRSESCAVQCGWIADSSAVRLGSVRKRISDFDDEHTGGFDLVLLSLSAQGASSNAASYGSFSEGEKRWS